MSTYQKDLPLEGVARCPFPSCNTRIILLKQVRESRVLVTGAPEMVVPNQDTPRSDDFFRVDDVWDFDNIGVSRPAQDLPQPQVQDSNVRIERLLVCSECDQGPLGFAGFEDGDTDVKQLKYFLACLSLLYN